MEYSDLLREAIRDGRNTDDTKFTWRIVLQKRLPSGGFLHDFFNDAKCWEFAAEVSGTRTYSDGDSNAALADAAKLMRQKPPSQGYRYGIEGTRLPNPKPRSSSWEDDGQPHAFVNHQVAAGGSPLIALSGFNCFVELSGLENHA